MRRYFFELAELALVGAMFAAAALGQDPAQDTVVLRDGTPVRLRITKTLSAASAQVGDKLSLEVVKEVMLENKLVVARGGSASATVVEAMLRKGKIKESKLAIRVDLVRLADGETVPLRADKANSPAVFAADNSVDGNVAAFVPGSELTVYVSGDSSLATAHFQLSAEHLPEQDLTRVEITSTPAFAEVNVDGKFISNTPALVGLAPGAHILTVRSVGYNPWQRNLVAAGGSMKFQAQLIQDGTNGSTVSNCWGGTDCNDAVGDVAGASRAARENQNSQKH